MSLGSGWKLRSLVPIMVSGASCGGEANVSDAQTATPAIERCYGTFSTGCPAKGNLLYLGFGEAGPHHQLSDAPRIGHGEGAGRLRVGRRNMSLCFQYPAHERESRVAFAGCPDGES